MISISKDSYKLRIDNPKLWWCNGFEIPTFCKWTPADWADKGTEYNEIRDNMLGWDITDYGLGKFDEVGFTLITIRNGNLKMDKYTKTYAEKLLTMRMTTGSMK